MGVATDESVSKCSKTTVQNCLLSFEEATLAEKMVEVLLPFKKGTEVLCSETNPTIYKVLPVILKLSRVLEENDNDPAAAKALKKKMRDQMHERTETEDVALLGTILNPYTKGFEHVPADKARAQQVLMSAMKDINIDEIRVVVKKEKDENQQEIMPELPKLPGVPEGIDTEAPKDENKDIKKAPELVPELKHEPPTVKISRY